MILAQSLSELPAQVALVPPPAVSTAGPDLVERSRLLARLGAQITILEADVADEQALHAIIAQASNIFGGLNGIIYTVAPAPRALSVQPMIVDRPAFDAALEGTIRPVLALAAKQRCDSTCHTAPV